MIEEPPALTIRRHVQRPAKQSLELLRGVPTAFVIDAMNGRGALDHEIKPLGGQAAAVDHLVGTAVTCHCGPADNLALFATVSMIQHGDIVVAATDRFEATCVTGDQLMALIKNQGAIGLVTDGLVRDRTGILQLDIPVFCRGVTPNAPVGNGPGTVGLDITVGSVKVASGDVVIADGDGIVVVPNQQLPAVLDRLGTIKRLEAKADAAVKTGNGFPDHIRAILDSNRVRYVD